METGKRKPKAAKIAITIVAVAALAALLWWLSTLITPDELQAWLRSFGVWAPIVYILMLVILPIFFMPVAPMAMIAGLLFGLWPGYLYTVIGCMLNCALMYLLTQKLGKARIQAFLTKRLSPAWLARIESLEGRTGFIFLIILRLTALIPYNVINYAFGLTNMKFRDFMLASLIGILPDMLIYVNMGDKALDITSGDFWLALVFLALFIILSIALMWWFFPRSKGEIAFTPLPGEQDAGALPEADPLVPDELEWLVTTGAGTRPATPTAGVKEVFEQVGSLRPSWIISGVFPHPPWGGNDDANEQEEDDIDDTTGLIVKEGNTSPGKSDRKKSPSFLHSRKQRRTSAADAKAMEEDAAFVPMAPAEQTVQPTVPAETSGYEDQ